MLCGDADAAIIYKDGTVEELTNSNKIEINNLDNSVLSHMNRIAHDRNVNVVDTMSDDEIKKMLEKNRRKKNIEDGYWILGTNVQAVGHGVLVEKPAVDIEKIILHSDGFNYKILGLMIKDVINECTTQKKLELLQKKIRAAEDEDKYCNKQARFRIHDDMSVIINDMD